MLLVEPMIVCILTSFFIIFVVEEPQSDVSLTAPASSVGSSGFLGFVRLDLASAALARLGRGIGPGVSMVFRQFHASDIAFAPALTVLRSLCIAHLHHTMVST